MQAYGKFVLVKPITGSDTTKSGIFLPNGAGDTKNHADVVSVGNSCQDDGNGTATKKLKIGDRVIHGSAIKFPHDGVDYLVVKEEDILVILGHKDELV